MRWRNGRDGRESIELRNAFYSEKSFVHRHEHETRHFPIGIEGKEREVRVKGHVKEEMLDTKILFSPPFFCSSEWKREKRIIQREV